jgi:pimeloyl-ACP methyl ester carboxylesterase
MPRDTDDSEAEARRLADDLRGVSRLAIGAVTGITDVVEAMHSTIAGVAPPVGKSRGTRTRGISGLVYKSVRGVTQVVGAGLDKALDLAAPLLGPTPTHPAREGFQAALNGVFGDHLAATGNPLAIPMQLRRQGKAIALQRERLATAIPQASPRVLVLLHGLCMTDHQWRRGEHDHGEKLAAELGLGAVYLRYNSGRNVAENGRELAALLDALLAAWPVPVESLTLLGHSMGGLVARSAIDIAETEGTAWRKQLRTLVTLGTPHHGAPLERAGHLADRLLTLSPYSAPIARLGGSRSAGIRDLRHGHVRPAGPRGERHPVPLPQDVSCHAIAATRTAAGSSGRQRSDGLVPVASALGHHKRAEHALAFPPEKQHVVAGCDHFGLLGDSRVHGILRRVLKEGPSAAS